LKKAFTNQDAKLIALVLNTAEYCHNTTEQLELKIREKIDPMLADKVDFNDSKESFLTYGPFPLFLLFPLARPF